MLVLLFYPAYVKTIKNFYCIIGFTLHHSLSTTLRDNVLTILVNILEIIYVVIIIHGYPMVYMVLCFMNYSYTINN